MEPVVVRHRAVPVALALLPCLGIVLAARLLALSQPPLALRIAAAALVAVSAWTSYRLLTASVSVGPDGVSVRGVMYDATVRWGDLVDVRRETAPLPVRLLLAGVLAPYAVVLADASGRTLRPVALLAPVDDDDVTAAVTAMRRWVDTALDVPTQRQAAESEVSAG